ncbi:MAG: PcfJ domain-containing protein [Faecalibacterium sp.]|nr:PcfJ domain-containing protein [Faecalibacterium sp.]
MTGLEELRTLCPAARAPGRHKGYVMTVELGAAKGRYIHGPALTAAVWDQKREPLAVWWFCGKHWTGKLRYKEARRKDELWPGHLHTAPDKYSPISWVDVQLSERDRVRMRRFFKIEQERDRWGRFYSAVRMLEDGITREATRKEQKKVELGRALTRHYLKDLPLQREDLEQQIRKAFSNDMFLWFENDRRRVVDCVGNRHWEPMQRIHCDRCNSEYITAGHPLSHLKESTCDNCGAHMTAHNVKISAKSKSCCRTIMVHQTNDRGTWLMRYKVDLEFYQKADIAVRMDEIYLLGPDKLLAWDVGFKSVRGKKGTVYEARMRRSANLDKSLVGYAGHFWEQYQYNIALGDGTKREIYRALGMDYAQGIVSVQDAAALFGLRRRVPMLESLIKTGWGKEVLYASAHRVKGINLRSKTYYGVFGLNRQELKAVGEVTIRKSVCNVERAHRWKAAGLPITSENLRQVWCLNNEEEGLTDHSKTYGVGKVLKYLRQQTRRTYPGREGIDRRCASDWLDYLNMAKRMKMDVKVKKIAFPLNLKRRHDELVEQVRRQQEKERFESGRKKREKRSAKLNERYPKEAKVLAELKDTYNYKSGEFCIITPATVLEIMEDSEYLSHCVGTSDRYFERIAREESYILFLRRSKTPAQPWYTLEVEPGGTIRQKRSYYNEQNADLEAAAGFLMEWQAQLASKLTARQRKLAAQAKELRMEELAQLRQQQNRIRSGKLRGRLLAEVLEEDLMEAPAEQAG